MIEVIASLEKIRGVNRVLNPPIITGMKFCQMQIQSLLMVKDFVKYARLENLCLPLAKADLVNLAGHINVNPAR